jgi:hypothetical protein
LQKSRRCEKWWANTEEVPDVDYNALRTLTTPELMALSGLTRMQLLRLEVGGVIRPLRPGSRGRAHASVWSFAQALGVSYWKAFIDAGCHSSWAATACEWVTAQPMGELMIAFQEGRTVLYLGPTGEGRLLAPDLEPGATRAYRIKVAMLDLSKVYLRMLRRMIGYAAPEHRPALERLAEEVRRMAAEAARRQQQQRKGRHRVKEC